jgi:alkanesulfonate monooxygenase SsuD/methylene tetrahydromethanopterin reductase-like flavin-dependent oxidoreductase (luciferase family)
MKVGVSLPVFTADPSRPLTVAARAHELGVDGVFSPDHLFPPVFYPPSGPDRPALEAFSLLAAVAAQEPGLGVGTLVARVTLRAAGVLAKQAAALDSMSGGRAILALGTGDRASLPEHERYGIEFPAVRERIELLEETVLALRALFEGGSYGGGRHVAPMTGPLMPSGSPSLWVGGLSDPVLAVAGRTADAWNGWGLDAETFASKARLLHEFADGRSVAPTWGGIALVGEDDDDLGRLVRSRADKGLSLEGVWVGTVSELRGFAARLEDAGATWFVVLPAGPADRLDVILHALSAR